VSRPAAAILVLALACCARKESPKGAAHAADQAGSFGTSALHGKVTFHGTAPPPVSRPSRSSFPDCAHLPAPSGDPSLRLSPAGEVGDAFVWVKEGLPPGEYPPPSQPVTLDQRDCEFRPRVFGVQPGQPVMLVNSDPFLHNVHTLQDFNVPMPRQGMQTSRVFNHPGVMAVVACDVHGWMRAWAGVVPHPFFAVTAPDGIFEITGLPAGHYTVEVWQERLGRTTREVTLTEGERAALDVEMKRN
jgi:hypothetical protein